MPSTHLFFSFVFYLKKTKTLKKRFKTFVQYDYLTSS